MIIPFSHIAITGVYRLTMQSPSASRLYTPMTLLAARLFSEHKAKISVT